MKKSTKNKILFLLKNQTGCAIKHFKIKIFFLILTKFI